MQISPRSGDASSVLSTASCRALVITLCYDRPSNRYSTSFDAIVIDYPLPLSKNAFVVLSTHIRQLSHMHSTQ